MSKPEKYPEPTPQQLALLEAMRSGGVGPDGVLVVAGPGTMLTPGEVESVWGKGGYRWRSGAPMDTLGQATVRVYRQAATRCLGRKLKAAFGLSLGLAFRERARNLRQAVQVARQWVRYSYRLVTGRHGERA